MTPWNTALRPTSLRASLRSHSGVQPQEVTS